MDSSIFFVNQEPYCIWEINVQERNKEFLNGIDTDFFDYVVELHLNAEDKKRASIALRSTLHHAMETMFSLLGAYIQAPDCVYAWITKCSNRDLRELIDSVGRYNNSIRSKLLIEEISWEEISKSIFRGYLPESEKNEKTTKLFAELWSSLAQEFLEQSHIDEYNSIKHGFRIRSGGFSLAIGIEHEYGITPPIEEMKSLGHSEHGTTYFKVEPIGEVQGNRSLRSRRNSLNWSVEKTALLIQLVAMSILNVTSALKIANGIEASTCKFSRPVKDDDFKKPWSFSTGVTSSSMDSVIRENEIISFTKSELLNRINEIKKDKKK
jgi:hypothetical protein